MDENKNNPEFQALMNELSEVEKMGVGTGVGRDGQGAEEEPKGTETATDVTTDDHDEDDPNKDDPEPNDDEDEEEDSDDSDEEDSADDADLDEDDEDNAEEDEEEQPPKKSSKTIPIGKYHDEQRKRKDLERQLADLKKGNETKGSKREEFIQKFADQYGIEKEDVQELMEHLTPDMSGYDTALKIAKEQEEVAHFNKEFDSFIPELKAKYPKATPEQIEKARAKMDKLAHTKEHAVHELDYVFYKNRDSFGKIFNEKKTVKGFENSKLGTGTPDTYTAKDFTGKNATSKNFKTLASLPDTERSKIMEKMDVFAKHDFLLYQASNSSSGEEIKRRM